VVSIARRPQIFAALLVTLVAATVISVVFDLRAYRAPLVFFAFLFLPGYLIQHTLRLQVTTRLEGILTSVGLSLAFLILAGLVINGLLPIVGMTRPLTAAPLVLCLGAILTGLIVLAYRRAGSRFAIADVSLSTIFARGKLFSPLLPALILPGLAIAGTNLMNTTGNNQLLLILFMTIPLYAGFLLCLRSHLPTVTYPLALLSISVSALLARGLTSSFLLGGDIYTEYHATRVVLANGVWNDQDFPVMPMSSLGSSLLPAALASMMGIDPLVVFKVVYPVLASLIPVIAYAISLRHLQPAHAFIAGFFVISQAPFLHLLTGQVRVGMAVIIFAIALMSLLNPDIKGLHRRTLFLILGTATILAYYVTPIVLLLLLAAVWTLGKRTRPGEARTTVSAGTIVLFSAVIFVWWGQLTHSGGIKAYVGFVQSVLGNLSGLFSLETRGSAVQQALNPTQASIANAVTVIVNDLGFLVIVVGVLGRWAKGRAGFHPRNEYEAMAIAALCLLGAFVVLPWVSVEFSSERLFLQVVIVLAPFFVIGTTRLLRVLRSETTILVAGCLVLALFAGNSFLLQHFSGQPVSEIFDERSQSRYLLYVHDGEVAAADWLLLYGNQSRQIAISSITQPGNGIFEFTQYGVQNGSRILYFTLSIGHDPQPIYILLREITIVEGKGYTLTPAGGAREFSIKDYAPLTTNSSKIYSSGRAEILF